MRDGQERSGIFASSPAWSAAEAIAFDRHLQLDLGLPAALLMENAGAALALEASQMASSKGLTRIVLFCGPGNNGGDALVAARHLAGSGPQLQLRLPIPLAASAASAWQRLAEHLPDLSPAAPDAALDPRADLLVDALFGLGLARPPHGAALACVRMMNDSGAAVLAADLPTGLQADRGEILGAAVRATRTLSFVAPKHGMRSGEGPACCGEVRVAQIGVSAAYAALWLGEHRAQFRD